MEYNTVFNIGDTVWFMYQNKVNYGRISSINYKKFISPVDFNEVEFETYFVENLNDSFNTCQLFSTKEDLIRSL